MFENLEQNQRRSDECEELLNEGRHLGPDEPDDEPDGESGDEHFCSDNCRQVYILAHPGLPQMSYTKHVAECAIGQRESGGIRPLHEYSYMAKGVCQCASCVGIGRD